MKLREARRDFYRRRAKKEGYLSRAAYKLIQINKKYRVIKPGNVVIDFGCAPGGWLQISSKVVGRSGFVLGVDLRPVRLQLDNVSTVLCDVTDSAADDIVLKNLPRRADVILSDLSPNISGIWELDHIRQIELVDNVLRMMPSLLKRGGSAVLKLFQGEELEPFIRKLRKSFDSVRVVKPLASRGESSEVYVVCLHFHEDIISEEIE